MTPEEATNAFDSAARTEEGPSPAVVAAVLDAAVETEGNVLDVLLDVLQEMCDSGDEPQARRYAAALTALVPALAAEAADVGEIVAAAVDLELAYLCAYGDRWDEVALRARRVGPVVAELLPSEVGRWELVMAGLAEHEGRDGEAVARTRRAEDSFTADARWDEAGEAAAARAAVRSRSLNNRMNDLRDAATFFALAERVGAVRMAVEEAAGLVGQAFREDGPEDGRRVERLAAAARKIALNHGFARLAVDVGVTGNAPAVASTLPWETVQGRIAALRAEYSTLPEHPDTTRGQLAVLDMQEGLAAQYRNRPNLAEKLLVQALEVFRAEGMAAEAHACEEGLASIVQMSGGRVPDAPCRPDPADPTNVTRRAFRLLHERRPVEALEVLDTAVRELHEAGETGPAVFAQALAGLLALGLGDHAAARRAAAAAAAAAPAAGTESMFDRGLGFLGGILDAELAGLNGDRNLHLRSLEHLEQDMLAADAGIGAAKIAQRRARLLFEAGRAGEALDVVLPAMLALDAHRTALPDAARRRSWADLVSHGFDTAFRSAVLSGRVDVVAELLEVGRGNGIPLPRGADDRADAVSALANLVAPEEDAGNGTGPPPTTLSGARAVAGAERTALGVPATLRTPWRTVALAAHLERARRYRDPVRSADTVQWLVVPT